MEEVINRHQKGELAECFVAKTETVVEPVSLISYKSNNYSIPLANTLGKISYLIRKSLLDIQEGRG